MGMLGAYGLGSLFIFRSWRTVSILNYSNNQKIVYTVFATAIPMRMEDNLSVTDLLRGLSWDLIGLCSLWVLPEASTGVASRVGGVGRSLAPPNLRAWPFSPWPSLVFCGPASWNFLPVLLLSLPLAGKKFNLVTQQVVGTKICQSFHEHFYI